ncbi:MAG TPA: TetR/AcrR family transcriptional regulator [Pedomonas sp.]|uniref:TetR/AcrR family transcriptional regulator n=1 Tax=Pedomonas sp. TaxID=2976421 RepID=UPI002F3E5D17
MARPIVKDAAARNSTIVEGLINVFKHKGYDGASLSDLAAATGIAKASLYHRYPGGKPELGRTALAEAGRNFALLILKPLQTSKPAAERLAAMLDGVGAFYGTESPACLMNTLTLGDALPLFGKDIRNTHNAWQKLIARALEELGRTEAQATDEADDMIARIQGALVLTRLSDRTNSLSAMLDRIRASLGLGASSGTS